jgi:hypothetical protein
LVVKSVVEWKSPRDLAQIEEQIEENWSVEPA